MPRKPKPELELVARSGAREEITSSELYTLARLMRSRVDRGFATRQEKELAEKLERFR